MTTPDVVITTASKAVVEFSSCSEASIEVDSPSLPLFVEVEVPGPQGPPGPIGPSGVPSIAEASDVDVTNITDRSILYFDISSSKFKADSSVTTSTITDGGNF